MGDLITLADAKTYLQIGFTDDDALLAILITGFSGAVIDDCYRSIDGVISATDILDGGYRELVLKRRPVVSITSITDRIDGSIIDPTLYDLDTGGGMVMAGTPASNATVGVLDLSMFARNGGEQLWGFGRRRWQVIYQNGYAAVPVSVQLAVKILVAGRYNRRDDLAEETVGDYSYHAETGDGSGWSPQVKQILSVYSEDAIG